jgi:hypothetical protein
MIEPLIVSSLTGDTSARAHAAYNTSWDDGSISLTLLEHFLLGRADVQSQRLRPAVHITDRLVHVLSFSAKSPSLSIRPEPAPTHLDGNDRDDRSKNLFLDDLDPGHL